MTFVEFELSQAGNTVVPAILTLEAAGYTVAVSDSLCVARSDKGIFRAPDPVAVLGLITLAERRGPDWSASDAETADVLARFDLG